MVGDWTSAAEKDEFEPGERYQSIKPAFGELIDAENHEFAWYVCCCSNDAPLPAVLADFIGNFIATISSSPRQVK